MIWKSSPVEACLAPYPLQVSLSFFLLSPLGWPRLWGGLIPLPSCVRPPFLCALLHPTMSNSRRIWPFPPLGLTMGWAGDGQAGPSARAGGCKAVCI